MSTVTVTLERHELDALLDRASREAPRTGAEHRVVDDVRDQVSRDDIQAATAAAAKSTAEQLSLFDAGAYDA